MAYDFRKIFDKERQLNSSPMASVLVTGGSGFFGEHLCQQLLNKGCKVSVFDLNPPSITHENLSYVAGDVRNARAVRGGR